MACWNLYCCARVDSTKAVEAPKKAMIHIQKMAPGPPSAIAVATPTMLPVPTRPDKATQKASKEEMPCCWPSADFSAEAKSERIINPKRRTCTKRVRKEKYSPAPTRSTTRKGLQMMSFRTETIFSNIA